MLEIVPVSPALVKELSPLAAAFRVTLAGYKGLSVQPDIPAAREELLGYLNAGYPVFAAKCGGALAGYAVCRVDEPCVWVESLYVEPAFRRTGIAGALLHEAEAVAAAYGEETTFSNVHPNNHGMIAFLRHHGYTVLNLIELRKPWRGEKLTQVIPVGEHKFDY